MKVISTIRTKLSNIQKRRKGIAELNRLSDRELHDIGISRHDIKRVIVSGER